MHFIDGMGQDETGPYFHVLDGLTDSSGLRFYLTTALTIQTKEGTRIVTHVRETI